MKTYGKILAVYGKIELFVAISAFSAALLLVTAQVLGRQFGGSLWWAQELAQLLIMYAYFLGVSHLYQVRQMVVVDFLVSRFSPRMKRRFYILSLVAVVVFCTVLLVAISKLYVPEMRFPSFVIQVPRFYWTLPMGIASASMILTSIYFLIQALRTQNWPASGQIEEFEQEMAFAASDYDY